MCIDFKCGNIRKTIFLNSTYCKDFTRRCNCVGAQYNFVGHFENSIKTTFQLKWAGKGAWAIDFRKSNKKKFIRSRSHCNIATQSGH